jgi:hypothetical protein
VATTTVDDVKPVYDAFLLACKGYDNLEVALRTGFFSRTF